MLAGEMTFAVGKRLTGLLVAAELDVLADFPVGVRTEQKGTRQGRVERRPPVPVCGNARKNRLDLLEEGLGVADCVRRSGLALERRQRNTAARVVDEDPGPAALPARHIPGVLVAGA